MASKLKRLVFVVLVSAAAGFSAGCESDGSKAATRHDHSAAIGPATTQSAQALTCDKCKVTWVKEPVTSGGGKDRVVAYQSRKTMTCPDCRTAVDNFFRTGQLRHTCKTCGTALEVCEAH